MQKIYIQKKCHSVQYTCQMKKVSKISGANFIHEKQIMMPDKLRGIQMERGKAVQMS